jgi:hypothetical protein
MNFKCDEGYGMYSISRNKDETFTVIQIKTSFIKEFARCFEYDDSFSSGLIDNEGVQDELNTAFDFASGMLADLIRDEAYKKTILTKAELEERSKTE